MEPDMASLGHRVEVVRSLAGQTTTKGQSTRTGGQESRNPCRPQPSMRCLRAVGSSTVVPDNPEGSLLERLPGFSRSRRLVG